MAVIAHDAGEVPAQGQAVTKAESFEALFADSMAAHGAIQLPVVEPEMKDGKLF